MFLMRADTLRGQVGGGWALEMECFLALWNGIEPIGEWVPYSVYTQQYNSAPT